MATHSSILAWRIPWTEEPGRLQSIGFAKNRVPLKQFSMHATGRKVLTKAKMKRLEKEWGWC